jgi:23S rRNA (guanosine2251-2'-O)-methyltransferase
VASDRERNDRRGRKGAFTPNPQAARPGGGAFGPGAPGPRRHGPPREDAAQWIWGWHAVEAALANPDRPPPERLLATADRAKALAALRPATRPDVVEPVEIARRLPAGAAHQGVALRTPPLEGVALEEIAASGAGVVLVLDQVTDPQNVGAILRSAAAFGARGVVMQDRHAPLLGGALAKAAAGALERTPIARVVNLSRALETLSELGWTSVGLDGRAETALAPALDTPAVAIVLGSEGEGLRRLVADHCDILAAIPMPGGFESLNVASAAAIALYAAACRSDARPTGE